MQKDNSIMGLDFGSSSIKAVVCELVGGTPVVRGVGVAETAGLEKSGLVDKEAYHEAVERAIKRAEQISGIRCKRVITNVPYYGIQFNKNMGLVLSPDDHHIYTEMDKKEAIRRSKNIVKPPTKKIMHVIPLSYTVAGRDVIDPVGESGTPLEVSTHLVLAETLILNDIVRLCRELGLTVEGIVFDGLASSELYLTDEERQRGAIVIDIGGQYTKAAVFRNHKLEKAAYIKLGGKTITQDIATCLKVSIPEAERLKVLYGQLPPDAIDPEDKIEITTENGPSVIKREHISHIMMARVSELISLLLKSLGAAELDPQFQLVLGGATSQIKGLEAWFSPLAGRPLRIGALPDIALENPEAASGLALVYYALKTGAVIPPKSAQKTGFIKRLMSFSK